MELNLGLAFIAGLVSFISPCVLPLVPAYVGYMGGRVTRTVSAQMTAGAGSSNVVRTGPTLGVRFNTVSHGIAFVGGFTLVFVSLGLLSTAFISAVGGDNITAITDVLGRVGGIVIIFFGLHFMGALPSIFNRLRKDTKQVALGDGQISYQGGIVGNLATSLLFAVAGSGLILWGFMTPIIALPVMAIFLLWLFLGGAFINPGVFWMNTLSKIENILYADTRREQTMSGRDGYTGSAFMGVVFSAGWTPCIGPVYGAVLTMAANTGDISSAAPLLAAYSMGLGIPFLLTAMLLDSAQGGLRRLQRHMRKIELVSGSFLILIGVTVASGSLQNLSQQFAGEFSDLSIRTEECIVGFVQGEIPFNHVGSCVGGTLIPTVVGESRFATLTGNEGELEFTFHAEAGEIIDFEIRNASETFTPLIKLNDPGGKEIVQSEESTFITTDDGILPLAPITLPVEGLYIARVANTQTVAADTTSTFRLTIERSEERSGDTAAATLTDNDVASIDNLAATSGPAIGLDKGNLAPDFHTVIAGSGEEISLSNLRGNVVLINFWATWCGPCRREMPEFQNAFEARADEGFTILAVDNRETVEDVLGFRDEFGLTFPLLMDESGEINDRYGIFTYPSTLIVDRDGVIIAKHFGPLTEELIQEMIDEALA